MGESNSLRGAEFDEAISHLKSEGIMKLSNQLGADAVANQILDSALAPFRWDVVDSRTITSDLSIESRTFPISPSVGSKTFPTSPSVESNFFPINPSVESKPFPISPSVKSKTIPVSSSIGSRISPIKPNSISSILNPPEAAQEPHLPPSEILSRHHNRSKGSGEQLELRNSCGKRRRVNSVSTPDPILPSSPNASGRLSYRKMGSCPVDQNKMERIFGKRLFDGMMGSRKKSEDCNHQITNALCVHYPYLDSKEDFIYKIWVCSSIGKDIFQTTMGEGDGLRDLLGDILIEGMEASLCRQRESRRKIGAACAFRIFSSNDDDASDYEVEMKLDFQIGKVVMFDLFR
ncbi:hypothetical protein OCU04_012761 [Sclerotinia nivalis]|uniref:Uncharacterized protein n=1 Tax=Sclerotinia nivalis TaxID=352851 RepID=A0A9X0AA02_9HELO|nr:hypothetical protein OCU04_012761 [Sclerotinia nivalis]